MTTLKFRIDRQGRIIYLLVEAKKTIAYLQYIQSQNHKYKMSGDATNVTSASKRKQPESDLVEETVNTSTEPKPKKQKKSKVKSQKEVVEGQESTEPATEESKEAKKAKKASKKAVSDDFCFCCITR